MNTTIIRMLIVITDDFAGNSNKKDKAWIVFPMVLLWVIYQSI